MADRRVAPGVRAFCRTPSCSLVSNFEQISFRRTYNSSRYVSGSGLPEGTVAPSAPRGWGRHRIAETMLGDHCSNPMRELAAECVALGRAHERSSPPCRTSNDRPEMGHDGEWPPCGNRTIGRDTLSAKVGPLTQVARCGLFAAYVHVKRHMRPRGDAICWHHHRPRAFPSGVGD